MGWEERDEPGDGGCESPALAAEPEPKCSFAPKVLVGATGEAMSTTGCSWRSGAGDQLRAY